MRIYQQTFLATLLGCTYSENIVYLVGRADSMCTTFYLIGVMAYLSLVHKRPALNLQLSDGSSARLGGKDGGMNGVTFTRWLATWTLIIFISAVSGLCKETGVSTMDPYN
jgi:hypothetical protein